MSNDLWQHIPPLHHSHLSLSESRLEVETGHLGKKSDVLAANCRAIKYGSLFFIYIYLILYMRIKKITFRNQSIYIYIHMTSIYLYWRQCKANTIFTSQGIHVLKVVLTCSQKTLWLYSHEHLWYKPGRNNELLITHWSCVKT